MTIGELKMTTTVRVQEKGQVTIPREIRRKLKLKKGDLVTFVNTPNGIVIKTLDAAADDLMAELGKKLQARGISVEDLVHRSQSMSSDKLAREFGLTEAERKMLYQALQLRAQAAVESIRTLAEESGSYELNDEDIEAEIQQARDETRDADRS
jgi:AbrB family looped-hinge helix DNA binding protein